MESFDWYNDEEDEPVEGLFGDRHSSFDKEKYKARDKKVFDRDRYNEDGNSKGWSKTKDTW